LHQCNNQHLHHRWIELVEHSKIHSAKLLEPFRGECVRFLSQNILQEGVFHHGRHHHFWCHGIVQDKFAHKRLRRVEPCLHHGKTVNIFASHQVKCTE